MTGPPDCGLGDGDWGAGAGTDEAGTDAVVADEVAADEVSTDEVTADEGAADEVAADVAGVEDDGRGLTGTYDVTVRVTVVEKVAEVTIALGRRHQVALDGGAPSLMLAFAERPGSWLGAPGFGEMSVALL